MHSEFNNLQDRSTHFLQIWIKSKFKGVRPSYEQKHFDRGQHQGRLALVASHTLAALWLDAGDTVQRLADDVTLDIALEAILQ